jgi:hypothetical protein
VTGLRAGGPINRFLIHGRAGFCVFFTAFKLTRGLAVTHFKNFCNLRIWFADSHSNSVSRTIGILIPERGRNYSEDSSLPGCYVMLTDKYS